MCRYYNDLGEYSLDPASIKSFKTQYHLHPLEAPELWSQWKREAVTDLVRRISKRTKKLRKDCQVSAATWNSYYNGYSRFYQDSWKWMKEGQLDFATPMTNTTDTKLFKLWSTLHLKYGEKDSCLSGHWSSLPPPGMKRKPGQIILWNR